MQEMRYAKSSPWQTREGSDQIINRAVAGAEAHVDTSGAQLLFFGFVDETAD